MRLRFFPALVVLATLYLPAVAPGQSGTPPQTFEKHAPDADDSDDEDFSCSDAQRAALGIYSDPQGDAWSWFGACFDPAREPQIRERVRAALGCAKEDFRFTGFRDKGLYGVQAGCARPLRRDGRMFSGELPIQPIRELLQPEDIRMLAISVEVPTVGDSRCTPAPASTASVASMRICQYFVDLKPGAHTPGATAGLENAGAIQFQFGNSGRQIGTAAGILGGLLLLPILITLWLRRRALQATESDRMAVWFGYFRFMRWTAILGGLVWWAALDMLQADELISSFLPQSPLRDHGLATMLPWILLWLAAAVDYMICLALSSPIHELRGIKRTRAEAWERSFWAVARFFLPLALLLVAIGDISESPRTAVLLFVTFFLAAGFATRRLAKAYGVELHALSSGELRDRVFALAKMAGTRLHQLYVVPTERLRLANAAAALGQNVFLTDYLLKNLSRREVDAVVGHELTHLQLKHLKTRVRLTVLFIAPTVLASEFPNMLPPRFPTLPVVWGVCLLGLLYIIRRHEFAADAGSVKLTGDAEAMMSGLAKLSRLNMMPMRWGRLDEKIITHPSVMRRITSLARAAGMGDDRVSQILHDSAAPPTETYSLPGTVQPEGKVFTTRYKSRIASGMAWAILLTGVVMPTVVAWAVQRAGLDGWPFWGASIAGLIATLGAILALTNLVAMRGITYLERQMRAKSETAGSPASDAVFVGFSPDAEPRIYENNWTWDAGFLSLAPERLIYRGEEIQFALRRDQISRIELGPGPASWLRTQSVYISWREPEGAEKTVNFRAWRSTSMLGMQRQTRALTRDLENWWRGMPAAPEAILRCRPAEAEGDAALGAPKLGAVTSTAPSAFTKGEMLARDFMVNTFYAGVAVVVTGLRLPLLDSILSDAAPPAARPVFGGATYVFLAVWLTRLFVLLPYRLAGRKRKAARPAAGPD